VNFVSFGELSLITLKMGAWQIRFPSSGDNRIKRFESQDRTIGRNGLNEANKKVPEMEI
jgi:hypothetical protein